MPIQALVHDSTDIAWDSVCSLIARLDFITTSTTTDNSNSHYVMLSVCSM